MNLVSIIELNFLIKTSFMIKNDGGKILIHSYTHFVIHHFKIIILYYSQPLINQPNRDTNITFENT